MSLDIHTLRRRASGDGDDQRAARRPLSRAAQRSRAAADKLKTALPSVKARAQTDDAGKTSAVQHALATPAALRRSYLRMLAPAHRLYRDRHVEKLLFKPSAINTAETDSGAIYDGPIPGQVLDWVIADFDVIRRECAFVDFRAGNGRTLLYASMHDFERVIGYEYDQATYEDAQLNISQFPRTLMKCRDVECRRGDEGDILIPDQPLVLFFPNAARERFLSLMLDHVAASYRLNPRRIYVIMENPSAMARFGHEDIFTAFRPPLATQLKLRLFSPVDIRVYCSLV